MENIDDLKCCGNCISYLLNRCELDFIKRPSEHVCKFWEFDNMTYKIRLANFKSYQNNKKQLR